MFLILVATLALEQANPPSRIERFLDEPIAVITVGGDHPWRLEISSGLAPRGDIPPTAVVYVAELFEGYGSDVARVGEVDTRTCLPLVGVISDISGLFSPRIDIGQAYGMPPQGSGVHPPGLPRIAALDGQPVTIEADAVQTDGSPARLSFTSNAGPVADFAFSARQRIATCFEPRAASGA